VCVCVGRDGRQDFKIPPPPLSKVFHLSFLPVKLKHCFELDKDNE